MKSSPGGQRSCQESAPAQALHGLQVGCLLHCGLSQNAGEQPVSSWSSPWAALLWCLDHLFPLLLHRPWCLQNCFSDIFSFLSPRCCVADFPLLIQVIGEVLPPSLAGSASASSGSGTGCV